MWKKYEQEMIDLIFDVIKERLKYAKSDHQDHF